MKSLVEIVQVVSFNTSELLNSSRNQPDELLCYLAIISVLDPREREMEKGVGVEHRMSTCQRIGLGVSVGAGGSGDF